MLRSAPQAPSLREQRRWRASSLLLLFLSWLVTQFFGLFRPGLLDDVDSIYTEVAREMLARHDYVTPTVDGIRFFDKPPLMYWLAAGSMHLFGQQDWAARLPLALGVLGLLIAVYALGVRFFAAEAPQHASDRGGLYAALATGLCLGTYLYTRFYIPDVLMALWMTLSVHLFLIALDHVDENRSALWPSLGFAAVLALSVLTKGLIGILFPLGFAFGYLLWTRRLGALRNMPVLAAGSAFTLIAGPWHLLAAFRNPPTPMPPGLGLPSRAGWAWFYLYNEHVARFLQRRIPHDYGQVPVPLFWLLLFVWLLPWTPFVVPALVNGLRELRSGRDGAGRLRSNFVYVAHPALDGETALPDRRGQAARVLLLWAGLVLGFFTLSSRQEYYHLPALPALALLAGGFLALADTHPLDCGAVSAQAAQAQRQALSAAQWTLAPLGTVLCAVCGYFAVTAPTPAPGATLDKLLQSNPEFYNLSLGHIFDLTGRAMGMFRGPLITVALGMLILGPIACIVRRKRQTFAANLLVAGAMCLVLLGAHEGLVRFYPILGSKELAEAIQAERRPGDVVAIDGELTAGSTLLFYGKPPVYLVNGRVNGPWFGSFWPNAPKIFLDDRGLAQLWSGPTRVFLLTYHPEQRSPELARLAGVHTIARSGGKTVLTNR